MSLWTALAIAVASAVVAGLVLRAVFRRLDIEKLQQNYRACAGGWHEGELNQCQTGLHRLPQQPVNTYSNCAYVAAGLVAALDLATPASFVFVLTSFYLCVGSALYHGVSSR